MHKSYFYINGVLKVWLKMADHLFVCCITDHDNDACCQPHMHAQVTTGLGIAEGKCACRPSFVCGSTLNHQTILLSPC